jgi:hypothetical protein
MRSSQKGDHLYYTFTIAIAIFKATENASLTVSAVRIILAFISLENAFGP